MVQLATLLISKGLIKVRSYFHVYWGLSVFMYWKYISKAVGTKVKEKSR